MGRIVVLDQNMVNMIAAGEVIERPASVVKELMENSIDSGATKITVAVEDGGRRLISVTDNGCGMDSEDLARAFEAHATSKVTTSADLRTISTLGFRGEALASIASVAQVRAVSRTADSSAASCIEIDCGTKSDVTPCSGDYGTTIQVRDIFYKLPARRKFLKTANTEMTHVTEYFTRIALAGSGLDMTLSHNQRELYRFSSADGLRSRIAQLFSCEVAENLIETETAEKDLHIFALMGKPDVARTNARCQYVFLNGRFIRDRFISHAIKEAYRGTLEADRFPVVFLYIRMPHEEIDVNVHPTKIEVRFYNSNLVYSQILGCLREKLLGTNLDVAARLPHLASLPKERTGTRAAGLHSQRITDAMAEFFKKHRPVETQQQFSRYAAASPAPAAGPAEKPNAIQIHDSFIVAQADDGFVVVDQHALHERIIYEDLRRRTQKSKLESQRLLIPESFEITQVQADAVAANAALIEKLGIELVPFGPKTMAIQAFPTALSYPGAITSNVSALDFVRDLLDLLADKELSLDADRLFDQVLNMAACKAAIKAGQKLSDVEIQQLLADREKIDYSSRCPHGRPTAIKFALSELEKQFKRT